MRPYITHTPSAVRTTFYMAEFFVSEGMKSILSLGSSSESSVAWCGYLVWLCLPAARKNFHSFASEEQENKALIYNYNPVYTGQQSPFEQIYLFWCLFAHWAAEWLR